ncbi:MAG: hypothetical protein J6R29_02695, partial [Clostridia bacterium]|nr:hypothetical protein [Clostridia bacterium]
MQKNNFTYKTFLIFILSTLICVALSSVSTETKIFSAPFYISLIYLKFSPLLSSLAFLIGLLFEFDLISFYAGIICVVTMLLANLIY